jgi:hypothetical protein
MPYGNIKLNCSEVIAMQSLFLVQLKNGPNQDTSDFKDPLVVHTNKLAKLNDFTDGFGDGSKQSSMTKTTFHNTSGFTSH